MNLRNFFAGTAILLAISSSATAQGADNALLHSLEGCAGLSDSAARLTCYDRLAPQVKAALATPVTPAPATAAAAAPPATPTAPAAPTVASAQPPAAKGQSSWFGLDNLFGSGSPEKQTTPTQFGADQLPSAHPQAAGHEIDSISAHVSEYAMNPLGKFIVFLDNGQVWRELQSEASHVYFRHDAHDNMVMIERGMLGSYILHLNGSMRGYKVERVK